MSSTGYPGGDPTKVGFPIVDAATAHALCHGIMAALLRRERSGSGGVVRVSLFDMAVALQAFPLNQFLATGEQEQRSGNSATYSAPADLFHCRDGSIVISANTDGLWGRLAETIGVAHLAADPRFATNADRVRNRRELIELINERLSEQDVATWIERLQQTGLVVGWVADYDAVTASLRRRRTGPLAALGGSAFVIRNPIELVGTEQPPAHLPVAAVATDLTWLDASEQQPERP
jgi:formyl-CoA transferase